MPEKITVKKTTVSAIKKGNANQSPTLPKMIDHFILKAEADEMINQAVAKNLLPPIQFSAEAIKEILAQKDCAYLRIYAAINKAGKQTYVLTGGDKHHNRIDVIRKKKTSALLKSPDPRIAGDMNVGQVCNPATGPYQKNDDNG